MFLVLIAIQACLIIYMDQDPADTVIWTFITGLNSWGTLGLVLGLIAISAGVGLVGVAASSVFGFKTDFLIFAPAIGGFILTGVVLTNLARAIQDSIVPYLCSPLPVYPAVTCAPVSLLIAITVGPLALLYVWTIIEWWRGKDF